jgi:hypothetical protein
LSTLSDSVSEIEFSDECRAHSVILFRAADARRSNTALAVSRSMVRPDGTAISVDNRSLIIGGARICPVMGEFHYSRFPAGEWRRELVKMKMGGVDIVSTYVFWIHHEEIEGEVDWSGDRNLRAFVNLCAELGLMAIVRCGPWCHGECRNGGLPDWLADRVHEQRSNDPRYLDLVSRFYAEIGAQLTGLLWKDGGPVIGIQVENEYPGPAEHLLALKRLAIWAGLDVPLYTRTGWPDTDTSVPIGELLPLYGGYPDGFWSRTLDRMPSGFAENFLFRLKRGDIAVATDILGIRQQLPEPENDFYPYLACEIGGGMASSYHRRIRIDPRDIEALALVKIGSGNCLQGYYMYHGGTNPDGRLTTLQESQSTGYWNDLPIKTYDFQAPLGEFGQMRPHYHRLRRLHLFLRDFGRDLAGMPTVLPTTRELVGSLNCAIRTDGDSGFVFVSNYERLCDKPAMDNVQFDVSLDNDIICLPSSPIAVPANSVFFWPFHLDLSGASLTYATAQPICKLDCSGESYFVFAATEGIDPEFVLADDAMSVVFARGVQSFERGAIRIRCVGAGTHVAITLRTRSGKHVHVIVLTDRKSLECWKAHWFGRERIFLTRASLTVDRDIVTLTSELREDLRVSVFPAPDCVTIDGDTAVSSPDGVFACYSASAPARAALEVGAELIRESPGPVAPRIGGLGVAEAPSDADFDNHASIWRLRLPPNAADSAHARLRIAYLGDVARVTLDGRLVADNFYNGVDFELGLERFAPSIYSGEIEIAILPLDPGAPIYLSHRPAELVGIHRPIATLERVDFVEDHEVKLRACTL